MRLRYWFPSGLALVCLSLFPETSRAQNENFRNIQGTAVSATSIAWLWTGTGGAVCYRVLDAGTGAATFVTEPSFNQTGLSGNTTNSIRVDVDMSAPCSAGDGNLASGPTIYTLAVQPTPAATPITNTSNFGFTGNWTLASANGANTKYKVKRIKVSDASVTDREENDQLFSDFNDAAPNTTYRMEVTAVNGNDLPAEADRVFVVLGTTTTLASQPLNPAITGNTPGSLTVQWEANNNPSDTEYEVKYTTTGSFATHTVTWKAFGSGFTALSTTITGLLTGRTHTIQITPRNRNYNVGTAAQVVATTSNGGGPANNVLVTVPPGGALSTGGSIGNDRLISLNIPQGTFSQQVTILVSTRSAIAACGNLDAAMTVTLTPALQPAQPIAMSYTVPQGAITTPSRATLVRYDPFSNSCVPLKTGVSVANGLVTVTALTAHFSDFGIQMITPSGALSSARIFPNPFYVRKQGLLTIDRLMPSTRVRIYTLKGEEVFDEVASAAGIVVWTGNNKRGMQVGSGVYLVALENTGAKEILKVVVVR